MVYQQGSALALLVLCESMGPCRCLPACVVCMISHMQQRARSSRRCSDPVRWTMMKTSRETGESLLGWRRPPLKSSVHASSHNHRGMQPAVHSQSPDSWQLCYCSLPGQLAAKTLPCTSTAQHVDSSTIAQYIHCTAWTVCTWPPLRPSVFPPCPAQVVALHA